ncbi:hypothetical protein LSTR_LSTR014710 [Laodelphax striatellus]|uniref:Uncharacterized protein n=1 Tax=Laodelphax striatellus TaxID=195883 RepID=A0A482WPF9_LAOST|nr:hypothetical protein LSTR_LSTR014710 [Laodelphax striatellus]
MELFRQFLLLFVTLTTIDLVIMSPCRNDQALTKKPGYVALSLVFILFGLAVVAASINLLVLRFMTMNAEDVRRDDSEMARFAARAHSGGRDALN